MRPHALTAGVAAAAFLVGACGGSPSTPSSASPSSGVSTDTSPFRLALPLALADSTSQAYAVWPFGVHGSSHALDGHPGFDFEYRLDAPVLAAAAGVVDNVIPDAHDPSRRSVQLRHRRAVGDYLTDYTNLVDVPAAIVVGATVTVGQLLGTAGAFVGGGSAMIHFQLGDPTVKNAPTIIVSPENYFTDAARAQLDVIWRTAAYRAEWCEPLLTNSRDNNFPMSRTWTLRSGSGAASIAVDCASDLADPTYTMRASDGAVTDTGTLIVNWSGRPTTADFRSNGGSTRLATYDIVGSSMDLAVGAPGSTRPSLGAGALNYGTDSRN